ncbi:hypothetical protein AC579_1154 [Pseudocercospora musae]|uniref:Uncharacterized protein n=1 Tax=Pseudocercospora musae TaxID=113226 RepID=A0A139I300_9PEZI|nr:hypothetical protein AC579_1154 [Pseudocercospora musae]
MARASLFGILPTVMDDHQNNSETSSLYLDGDSEPLRRIPTPEDQQPQLPRRDTSPRLRRKSAIRGSLRLCDNSAGQQNFMQHATGEQQLPLALSDISLGQQITTRSLESVSHFGDELTRARYDPTPQAGVFMRKQKRRAACIFRQLKHSFRCPFQDSSSSAEESAPPRLRVISKERRRPRSIGWPSRLDLANGPTECAYSSLPPPTLEAIPRVSSDIASWLSGLPDFTSIDASGGQSETNPKVATPASLPDVRAIAERTW